MNDQDLQDEIDKFMEIDTFHQQHFPNNEVSVDHWRKVRHHYTVEHAEDYVPDLDDLNLDSDK
jgi:hypothetical protein